MNRALTSVALCALTIIWCLGWFLTKIGLSYSSPFSFTAARFVIASVIMTLILAIVRGKFLPGRGAWIPIAAVGFLQTMLMFVLAAYGLLLVDISRATILIYATPIWAVAFGPMVLKERMSARRFICAVLGCLGIAFIIFPSVGKKPMLGFVLLILSSLCWAISTLIAKRYLAKEDKLYVAVWQTTVGAFGLVVLAYLIDGKFIFDANLVSVLTLIYVAVFGTVIAMSLWFFIIQKVEMIQSSLASLAVPILVMLIDSIFLDGKLDLGLLIGSAIILMAILTVWLQPIDNK